MAYTLENARELHYEVYGVYPSTWWMQCWEVATDEERLAEFDDLFDQYQLIMGELERNRGCNVG
jgi:hypothetical protein